MVPRTSSEAQRRLGALGVIGQDDGNLLFVFIVLVLVVVLPAFGLNTPAYQSMQGELADTIIVTRTEDTAMAPDDSSSLAADLSWIVTPP